MKSTLPLTLASLALAFASVMIGVSIAMAAPIGIYQHGTVVRMRMGDCMLVHRGFITRSARRKLRRPKRAARNTPW